MPPESMIPTEGIPPQKPSDTAETTADVPTAPSNDTENSSSHSQRVDFTRSNSSAQTSSSNNSETILLLGVSAAVLLIGLILAKAYKRRR